MRQKYQETFDSVHASQRLKAEVMNMVHQEKRTRIRRGIPSAALAAAVLVLILAGTAVAVEYFGWVTVERAEDFYHIHSAAPIPLENLSEEVRSGAGASEEQIYRFDSWPEGEEFLGMELMKNSKLEQFLKIPSTATLAEQNIWGNCLMAVGYSDRNREPCRIIMEAQYQAGEQEEAFGFVPRYFIWERAFLYTENCDNTEKKKYIQGFWGKADRMDEFEKYVTPSGLEVLILPEKHAYRTQQPYTYTAYFIKNNALFMLYLFPAQSHEGSDAENLAFLKEILDACE